MQISRFRKDHAGAVVEQICKELDDTPRPDRSPRSGQSQWPDAVAATSSIITIANSYVLPQRLRLPKGRDLRSI